jgi:zinc/manganese transport system substrate-binding protein
MTTERSLWTILTVLALVAAACGTGDGEGATTSAADADAENPDSLTVVATTTMLGDIASNVAGDEATVEVLMPVGADPHDFQASSQQVSKVSTADLVVANGLGLEESVHDALEGAESDGAQVLEVGAMLDPLPFGDDDHGEDEDLEAEVAESCDPGMADEHEEEGAEALEDEHGSCDPHIWMDPIRMADAALLVAAELEEIAPDGAWNQRAEAYAEELMAAHTQIEEALSMIPGEARVLVTNHEAFGYFAELYGFEIVGTIIPGGSTLGDPSSAELAELVDVIVRQDVPAIFTDSSAPSALADSIAAEAGEQVAVVELYSGSLGEPGSSADTLIGMLTTNAQRIADALS